MIPDSYHDFFVAEAGASAALIGLLFVAISVAPGKISGAEARITEQARASSALTSLLLPLTIALVALLPASRIGVPAIVLSGAGLLFVAATVRRFLSVPRGRRENWRGLIGLVAFVVVLGVVLSYGIASIVDPRSTRPIEAIAAVSVASILIGVERAWALIGGRDTGRMSTLRDLIRGEERE